MMVEHSYHKNRFSVKKARDFLLWIASVSTLFNSFRLTMKNDEIRLLLLVSLCVIFCEAFQLSMMGTKRGKGSLKQQLNDESRKLSSRGVNALNDGKGQEITGVTIPMEGKVLTRNEIT
jgi:hypothetical protein